MESNQSDAPKSEQNALPLDPALTTEQARVLGCLIEKQSTTPEAYPLTVNATVTACNQKSSRNPIMKLDPGRVAQALRQLQPRGLTESEYGARAERWAHRADETLKLTNAQRVLIGLLLLRGPQTLSELYSRSERMHNFDDLDDVEYQLQRMAGHAPAFVVKLPRAPGQREERWMHRLCGEPDPDRWAAPKTHRASVPAQDDGLSDRVSELEARVARLEKALDMADAPETNANEEDS